MSWSTSTEPGANKVSSPSITTLSEPSATQGETPSGQELSKLCGSYSVGQVDGVRCSEESKGEGKEKMMFGNIWAVNGRCVWKSLRD